MRAHKLSQILLSDEMLRTVEPYNIKGGWDINNGETKTFKETIMDKSNKSSTLKGAFTSKLSNYYHSKRVYKNITICTYIPINI